MTNKEQVRALFLADIIEAAQYKKKCDRDTPEYWDADDVDDLDLPATCDSQWTEDGIDPAVLAVIHLADDCPGSPDLAARCPEASCDFGKCVVLANKRRVFNMSDTFHEPCGAPSDIAAHAAATFAHADESWTVEEANAAARKALGLNREQADELFAPDDVIANCHSPKGARGFISPQRAAAVLRRFAETGVVDWSEG